jgi:hypothetical protein
MWWAAVDLNNLTCAGSQESGLARPISRDLESDLAPGQKFERAGIMAKTAHLPPLEYGRWELLRNRPSNK